MAVWLVTGGAGFIGSHLCETLIAQEDRVIVLDDLSTGLTANLPKSVELVMGSVTDYDLVSSLVARSDGCFHLAAIKPINFGQRSIQEINTVNLGGTLNLLTACQNIGKRYPIIYASTSDVYGDIEARPVRESVQPNPISTYGIDKLSSEMFGRLHSRQYKMPFYAFRMFHIYGPREITPYSKGSVVSVFAQNALNNAALKIHGNGMQYRDFVYVTDAVSAMLMGMTQLEAQNGFDVINLSRNQAVTIKDLAFMTQAAIGGTGAIEHMNSQTKTHFGTTGDNTYAATKLGWRAHTPLANGLIKILRHEQNKNKSI